LRGKAASVIRGLRSLATRRGLTASKKKAVREICNYLSKNLERMRYDEYLAAGYPIASGVIEGACRHLVKDRMERAGMHWTAVGAQAMLDRAHSQKVVSRKLLPPSIAEVSRSRELARG